MDILLLKVAYPLTPSGSIHTWKTIVSRLWNQEMSTWELEFYGYMEQCGAVLLLWIQYQRHKSDFLYCPFVPLNLWHIYYNQVKIYYCYVILRLKTGSIGRSEISWTQTCDWTPTPSITFRVMARQISCPFDQIYETTSLLRVVGKHNQKLIEFLLWREAKMSLKLQVTKLLEDLLCKQIDYAVISVKLSSTVQQFDHFSPCHFLYFC